MSITITTTEANNLFDQLRSNLLAAQDAIEEVITTRAWEPLGYDTFAEAWEERLHDVKLTGVMRVTVVYAMFNEGASNMDVASTLAGVGGTTVTALRSAYAAGMTPKQADIHASKVYVRSHPRNLPSKRNAVTLMGFTDEELKTWNDMADDLGVDRNDMLKDTLREAMEIKVEVARGV